MTIGILFLSTIPAILIITSIVLILRKIIPVGTPSERDGFLSIILGIVNVALFLFVFYTARGVTGEGGLVVGVFVAGFLPIIIVIGILSAILGIKSSIQETGTKKFLGLTGIILAVYPILFSLFIGSF